MFSSTSPLPDQNIPGHDLGSAYLRVRQISIDLTAELDPEDCVIQTISEVSPTKWHLAHTSWFFEQFCLLERIASYRPYDERFLYLFNSYYHSVGKMHARPKRGLLNRPLLRQVLDYRRRIDEAMLALIADNGDNDELAFVVTLGLHHEQQHQELMLTDIKHVFFTNPLQPAYATGPAALSAQSEPMRYVRRAGGRFRIGHDGPGFGFDNETPRHDVLVDEHELADRLVSNAEYREFIIGAGYRDPRLWMSDGFSRAESDDWNRPLYWSEDLETEFTLNGWRPIDPAAPVCHVSQYEADAFARWADARLPSESEWELAAADSAVEGNTLDRGLLHPASPQSTETKPIRQLWGDVWEWTASPYMAYPGFESLGGSLGEYNGKFMANQVVVRGGSCVTWAEHLRATYRSFFYPHDRWQFLGFRLARTV
ncbi:MAG TPA: ergothioneine biosynthesis protein EgtB [Gammaproteobacteria bacterium]|nr:ergothioneine biosynthesis protein EgtB [Gammaproteobacteria bacterium]